MARLIIRRAGADETVPIPPDSASFVIGRAPGCDLVIEDTASSRRHCAVERAGSGHRLVDLKSSNGTRLNGARVESSALKDGDAIQIGNEVIRFVADSADVAEIVLDEPAGGATFALRIRDGESIPLPPGRHSLGRAAKNTIVLEGTGVSALHAEIRVEGFEAFVKDLGSTNGTFVNGARVKESPLSHGDAVRFGGQSAEFVDTARAAVEATEAGDESGPVVASLKDADVPRRRGGIGVMIALLLLLGGGAAAYLYVPKFFPAAGGRGSKPAVHSADNLVSAAAFSFEGEGAGPLWRVRGEGSPATSRIGESDSASGAASLSLSSPDSRSAPLGVELAEPVAISSARLYRVSARVRGAGGATGGGAGVALSWVGGPAGTATEIAVDASDSAAIAGSGAWSEVSVVAAPPRGASAVRPVLFVAGGGAAAMFDDVLLTEAGDSAPSGGAVFASAESEIRSGPKGDLSCARGVRSLFHDLAPFVVLPGRPSEDGEGAPVELSSVFHGAVEGSRVETAGAEWTLALRGGAEPVTVKESFEPLPNGGRIALEWRTGSRAAAASGIDLLLDAAVEPVFTVVGEGGASFHDGEFVATGAKDVIVGSVTAAAGQGDPFRLRFSAPVEARVARGEDGGLRLRAAAAAASRLEVTLETSFVEERNRSAALRDAVKKAEGARKWGEALARAQEILNDLPFHEGAIEDARRVTESLGEKGEAEARRLEESLRDVEFLPTVAGASALLASASAAAEAWSGTRYADRASAVAAACRARLEGMSKASSGSEAERLRRRAADLEASGHPHLAKRLRDAAERLSAAAPAGDSNRASDGGGQ